MGKRVKVPSDEELLDLKHWDVFPKKRLGIISNSVEATFTALQCVFQVALTDSATLLAGPKTHTHQIRAGHTKRLTLTHRVTSLLQTEIMESVAKNLTIADEVVTEQTVELGVGTAFVARGSITGRSSIEDTLQRSLGRTLRASEEVVTVGETSDELRGQAGGVLEATTYLMVKSMTLEVSLVRVNLLEVRTEGGRTLLVPHGRVVGKDVKSYAGRSRVARIRLFLAGGQEGVHTRVRAANGPWSDGPYRAKVRKVPSASVVKGGASTRDWSTKPADEAARSLLDDIALEIETLAPDPETRLARRLKRVAAAEEKKRKQRAKARRGGRKKRAAKASLSKRPRAAKKAGSGKTRAKKAGTSKVRAKKSTHSKVRAKSRTTRGARTKKRASGRKA